MSRDGSQSIEFRSKETAYVMERWRNAESCALVGIGSVGKTNLMQHLVDSEVQTHYLGANASMSRFRAVTIDPSLMVALPAEESPDRDIKRSWAMYELMMHRMFLALYPFEQMPAEVAREIYDSYRTLQDGTNPLYAQMALRYFEFGLRIVLQHNFRIAFVFDEFDELLRLVPPRFFVNLRGLRDGYKRHLSYVTFTRRPLTDLVQAYGLDSDAFQPFLELFTDNVYYIGPYSLDDADQMIRTLAHRSNRPMRDYLSEFAYWATGGFAGLLRACYFAADQSYSEQSFNETQREKTLSEILLRRSVQAECDTLWGSLSPDEHSLLLNLLQSKHRINATDSPTQHAFTLLQHKALLEIEGDRVRISPPLFLAYLRQRGTA